LTIHIERETNTERIERCDHKGTTEQSPVLSDVGNKLRDAGVLLSPSITERLRQEWRRS